MGRTQKQTQRIISFFLSLILFVSAAPASARAAQTVLIDKRNLTLTLNDEDGTLLGSWPVAVGKRRGNKRAVDDLRTPEGTFELTERRDASRWLYAKPDGTLIPHVYGPLFFRLKTPPWRGIGIHGTNSPRSIGRRATLGCIRMHNADLLAFAELVRIGAKVTIIGDEK